MILVFFFHALFAIAQTENTSTDDTYYAPRQYIFADREDEDFSNRTSNAPFTDISPNPLVLTNSAFENLFYANTTVQARSQGSPGISLRGSSQASRVLFVLDDVPLNFADGFGGSSLLVPIELTQSIHIVEGPASALYGANAMAGAIHFKTKTFNRPVLRIGVGDADKDLSSPLTTANLALIVPYSVSENHSVLSSVFLEKDRGDYRHTTDGFSDTRKDNAQNLRRFTLGSSHRWKRWRLKTFGLYTGLNRETPGPLHTPLVTSQASDIFFGAVSAAYSAETYSSNSVLSASRFRSKYIDFSGRNNSDSERLFASEIFVKKLSDRWLSQTTLDFNYNRYQSSYTGEETFDRTEPEVAQTLVYAPARGLTVEPTLRYLSRYEHLLGQLHVPYKFENARLWMGYGQGFRPPSLTDLYAQTIFYVGNTDLQPEESSQVEFGIGWDLPYASVSSSVYKIRYSNLFRSFSVSPGVVSKTNVGKAETSGINMGVQFQPRSDLQVRLNHSLMSARELPSNAPLLFSPENQSFAALTYTRRKASFTLQHSLWSSFYDTDFNTGSTVKMPPWDGTDFFVSYQAHDEMTMGVGIFNIFDNPRQLNFDFPEQQRRVFLNLEVKL